MTGDENKILEKLMEALGAAGISPIPDADFLRERIRNKKERKQLCDGKSTKRTLAPKSDYSSPVCFAKSTEVQSDYINEEQLLNQIDNYINQLISNEEP